MLRRIVLLSSALLLLTSEASDAQPSDASRITLSGSLRSRAETMDWFGAAPGGRYSFLGSTLRVGLEQRRSMLDWRIEIAAPILLGLPEDAIAPAPQGLLGHGANYTRANDGSANTAGVFLKQGFLRWHTEDRRWQGRLGRFEFSDGAETVPASPVLAAVKRGRVAQRLIGPFGFTHAGRSFDGVDLAYQRPGLQVTLMAGRPTKGVFAVDGWEGVEHTGFGYASVTLPGLSGTAQSEFRAFGAYYRDNRMLVKADNRPLAVRQADTDPIMIGTIGGHYLQLLTTGAGPVDLMAWGAWQFGSWGNSDHSAQAVAVEAGWQPKMLPGLRPWLRAGYFHGSGDDDATDATHSTFFPLLPTPRLHARFPFYNSMNLEEASVSLTLRPGTRTTVRGDLRELRLANDSDGWYLGGGAFADNDFGYAMRPSHGSRSLATLMDLSVDVRLHPRWMLGAYAGRADAERVITGTYATSPNGWYGFLELEYRW